MSKASWSVVLSWLGLCACSGGSEAAPEPGAQTAEEPAAPRRIAVIPKGTTHEFWKSIHAGAIQAQHELEGVEVVWRGPEREDDRDQQISLVQSFVSQQVDAIVLAPLDQHALAAPVKLATRRGIPVVIIDSGLAGVVGEDFASYIATDNYLGGQLAAQHLAGLLEGSGRILMLRYAEGSESTTQRERGFAEKLVEFPDVELVDPRHYAGASRATAQEAAENLLALHAENIDGIFCSNESATFGMLLALRSRDLAGKLRFVGFDASEGLVEALRQGEIDGLVVQNPMRMGYEGVRCAVRVLDGQEVERRIDTGVEMATKANMDDPAVRQLLAPDLTPYLGR